MEKLTFNPIRMFAVTSSSGTIWADRNTGRVIKRTGNDDPENVFFENVSKFDIEEYKKHYDVEYLPESIDILDLGGWLFDRTYEEAAADWREEVKIMRNGQEL